MSLLSTKSEIRKWYKAMKKPHEKWTREETIELKRCFWPSIYGTNEERLTNIDHYVNKFKKKYPNRSEKSIKNKYSRIKKTIPEKKSDIEKLKEIQNSNGSGSTNIPLNDADGNNLLENLLKKKNSR